MGTLFYKYSFVKVGYCALFIATHMAGISIIQRCEPECFQHM